MKKNKSTRSGGYGPALRLLCWLPLLLMSLKNYGQPCATCVTTQANVSVDQNCMATITYGMIVQGVDTTSCPPYDVIVQSPGGQILATGTNFAQLDAHDLIGELVQVTVVHLASGVPCTRMAMIEDKLPPVLTCPADTISCTASIDPADLEPVVVTDNCGDLMTLEYFDDPVSLACDASPFIDTLKRHWIATDSSGFADTCVQLIFIRRADTSMIEFPANIPVDCGAPNLDPAIAGQPLIDGNPIDTSGFCKMIVHFTDDTVSTTTNCGIRILRNWQVLDHCTGELVEHTQIIKVEDHEAPTIMCQPGMTVPTAPDVCEATFLLPPPMSVSDNCGSLTITVIHPVDGVEQPLNQPITLPPGTFSVSYIVRDECMNADTCDMPLTVIDNQTPTAVCDEITSVSLPTSGIAVVPAFNFDDGSYDNCSPLHFLASRDGEPFAPNVQFDCDDVGSMIMVTVRVTEVLNGNSFSDCMVQVEVEDKLPPFFTQCPPDQTIDCEAVPADLTTLGNPVVFDNCAFTVDETSSTDFGICGTGTITRTFTATDASGNNSTCTQTITVENQSPFDGSTIVWPADFTTENVCLPVASFDPEDLPAGFDFPTFTSDGCAMIAVSYADQIFDIDFPACYKIVRTWTLIDWCQYDPTNPTVGVWSHQQLVKILDTVAPVVTCPDDVVVGIDSVCGTGAVTLDDILVDLDCNGEVTITNNSPYADASGPNASGFYPKGTHIVRFDVKDGCGNKASCQFKVTVVDNKKPTPYCNSGIVGELQLMNGQVMATITAKSLDAGSYDNCTAPEDLVFGIQFATDPAPGVPTATQLVFDCAGEGSHFVKVWVTDEAGNSDFCTTNIIIQDNMDVCPNNDDPLMAAIEGDILTEMGDEVEQVTVEVNGMNAFPDTTGLGGTFAIPNLPIGYNYTVIPQKDMHPDNGVTTWDLVLLTKHILGVKYLDSPYKIIAADVNKSGKVTTLDVVELRKLILGINDDFPHNTSWRFVEKTYQFPDPADPFLEPFPEVKNIQNLNNTTVEADFTAVKIGDLNDSAIPNSLLDVDDRSTLDDWVLLCDDLSITPGEEVRAGFRSQAPQLLIGCQFALSFDAKNLEFIGFEPGALSGLTDQNFGWTRLGEGIITMSYFDLNRFQATPEEPLFYLRFRAKTNARLSDLMTLQPRYTIPEAYDKNENLMNIRLEFDAPANAGFRLLQNQPNPFRDETLIRFELPEPEVGKLMFFDLSGRVVKVIERQFEQGYNEISVRKEDFPTTGILYYQLQTPNHTATRKMILIE